MESGQEVQLQIESARSIVLRYMGMSEADQEGCQTVYFELNGQPRQVRVVTEKREKAKIAAPKSDAGNECHVGCPMPGLIAQIDVEEGDEVGKGQSLFTIEAMKMQTTIRAERDGTIKEIVVSEAQQVDSGDLLAVFD
jgi:pyruvate carboxylase